jgi:hypothetical protein
VEGYTRISPNEVKPWLVRAARRAAREAAGWLNIPTPKINWHKPKPGHRVEEAAWIYEADWALGVINLNAAALSDFREVAASVYHEAKHIEQALRRPWLNYREREEEAQRFTFQRTGYISDNEVPSWGQKEH